MWQPPVTRLTASSPARKRSEGRWAEGGSNASSRGRATAALRRAIGASILRCWGEGGTELTGATPGRHPRKHLTLLGLQSRAKRRGQCCVQGLFQLGATTNEPTGYGNCSGTVGYVEQVVSADL